MNFKEWLLKEDAGSPSAKQALYPMGYGGIGLYPPSDVIVWGSDAIVYMPDNLRNIKFIWGDGMLANPFGKDSLYEKVQGKNATQIQAGNLERDDNRFKKVDNYATKINLHVIQAGALKKDCQGFEKSDSFIGKINDKGLWDYKQLANRPGKFALPISSSPNT